jgi:hypothetical protein
MAGRAGHSRIGRTTREPKPVPHYPPGVRLTYTPRKLWRLALKLKSKRIYAPRIVADHIMMPEDFERLHKFLSETEGLSEVSDDMRELVEQEWPELLHKLPPKVP